MKYILDYHLTRLIHNVLDSPAKTQIHPPHPGCSLLSAFGLRWREKKEKRKKKSYF